MTVQWAGADDLELLQKRQGTGDSNTDIGPTTTTTTSTTTSTTSSTTSTSTTSTTPTTSSTTTSSTTSIPTTTTPTTTALQTTSTPSLSTRSDNVVVTLTLTAPGSSTSTSASSGGGNKGFFDNKAQVGAVFGVAGVIALVLGFFLVTTCIRRRRAAKFDRDVAEAAAAAAAANADPFYGDEEDRAGQGASWDPRRTSGYGGYGRISDDPYGYAAAGVVGGGAGAAGAGAGFGRSNTNHYQRRDAYNMNEFPNSSNVPPSGYPNYGGGGAAYYSDLPQPQPEYGRPSFSSTTAPGIAGVGAAYGAAQQHQQPQYQDQQLRYRAQQQSSAGNPEDAYGGYAVTTPETDPHATQYSSNQASTLYTSGLSHRMSVTSNPTTVPPSQSPPPPPSYSGHSSHDHGVGDRKTARPPSNIPMSAAGPSMPLPPTPMSPDESWTGDQSRVLRVANE